MCKKASLLIFITTAFSLFTVNQAIFSMDSPASNPTTAVIIPSEATTTDTLGRDTTATSAIPREAATSTHQPSPKKLTSVALEKLSSGFAEMALAKPVTHKLSYLFDEVLALAAIEDPHTQALKTAQIILKQLLLLAFVEMQINYQTSGSFYISGMQYPTDPCGEAPRETLIWCIHNTIILIQNIKKTAPIIPSKATLLIIASAMHAIFDQFTGLLPDRELGINELPPPLTLDHISPAVLENIRRLHDEERIALNATIDCHSNQEIRKDSPAFSEQFNSALKIHPMLLEYILIINYKYLLPNITLFSSNAACVIRHLRCSKAHEHTRHNYRTQAAFLLQIFEAFRLLTPPTFFSPGDNPIQVFADAVDKIIAGL